MKRVLVLLIMALLLSSVDLTAQEAGQTAPGAAASDHEADSAAGEKHEHGAVTEKRFVATTGPDGIQHVAIAGGEYYFDPNYIVVKVNVPVELTVKKAAGLVPHDIIVKAPEAGIDFKAELKKDPQIIRFTPTKAGKYEMLCGKKLLFFKSHKDRGMDGVIEVVP